MILPLAVELHGVTLLKNELSFPGMERTEELFADVDLLVAVGCTDTIGGPLRDFNQEQARHAISLGPNIVIPHTKSQ